MKLACSLILTVALLVNFVEYSPAASEAVITSAYTLLFSGNVAGEIEPCG